MSSTAKTKAWRPRTMRESAVEQYLVRLANALGGKAYKASSRGNPSMPDRHVRLTHGGSAREFYVECKAVGRTTTRLQQARHEELRLLGATVYVCDSAGQVRSVMRTEAERLCALIAALAGGGASGPYPALVYRYWPDAYTLLWR